MRLFCCLTCLSIFLSLSSLQGKEYISILIDGTSKNLPPPPSFEDEEFKELEDSEINIDPILSTRKIRQYIRGKCLEYREREHISQEKLIEKLKTEALGIHLTLQNILLPDRRPISLSTDFSAYIKKLTLINTQLGTHSFYRSEFLEEVIAEDLTIIPKNAFNQCMALTHVAIPKVKTIEERAFLKDENLIFLLNNELETIGKCAFMGCKKLQMIALMSAYEDFKDNDFSFFKDINLISLPKLKKIEDLAFCDCMQLQRVLAVNVSSVGEYAFYNCSHLNDIILEGLEHKNNVATNKIIGKVAFGNCTYLSHVGISSFKTIGSYAFFNCTSLKDISIPNAENIGENIYLGCIKEEGEGSSMLPWLFEKTKNMLLQSIYTNQENQNTTSSCIVY